ncbi:uncharacterized protein BO87DRAFT_136814 [Aspergillus neoniger CBS 115656]|uniref:Uncharacterized protein n=1 Tax=Aspergillus neoniger (strain CBS 115656) TaxID=1448310 RepID=A0A318YFL0_ASPNB|nr:hypothetical protein BO87DRAFT_136814 [Aspergillus neoniger CBS 115656]PYH31253.1 hypothetical protein BO87DRAFT_136814 [Aspergillus neoniger CBS 115656]
MQGFEGSMIILLRVFVGSELHTHFRVLRERQQERQKVGNKRENPVGLPCAKDIVPLFSSPIGIHTCYMLLAACCSLELNLQLHTTITARQCMM